MDAADAADDADALAALTASAATRAINDTARSGRSPATRTLRRFASACVSRHSATSAADIMRASSSSPSLPEALELEPLLPRRTGARCGNCDEKMSTKTSNADAVASEDAGARVRSTVTLAAAGDGEDDNDDEDSSSEFMLVDGADNDDDDDDDDDDDVDDDDPAAEVCGAHSAAVITRRVAWPESSVDECSMDRNSANRPRPRPRSRPRPRPSDIETLPNTRL